jgi:D-glycero-alpha-D-manno-heptose-7-phosphate kinase
MIITRTPYRMSLLGGGTDYPAWTQDHPGAVLATAINKYCWVTVRWLPPFFDHKHRISYSRVEEVFRTEEINHPSVRETIKYLAIKGGLEIHHDGDLPGRSGMGTSSSFTVGLLYALNRLLKRDVDATYLAKTAIHIEQKLMKENVGAQDQTIAAYGGFNRIDFYRDQMKVTPIPEDRLQELRECLVLFFTGLSRVPSTQIAVEQIKQIPHREKQLAELYHLVNSGVQVLCSDVDILEIGRLMHEGWMLKRLLSRNISTDYIDHLYQQGRKAGAVGGKLLGAGGGGFMLFMAPPDRHQSIKEAMNLLEIPFAFEPSGSTVIFESQEEAS